MAASATPSCSRSELIRSLLGAAAASVAALALAGGASAFTCPETPLTNRIADAEAVFVGRSTGFVPAPGDGVQQRLYTFTVDQEVKGDLPKLVKIRIPVRDANGGQKVPPDVDAGILMNRVSGVWYTTRCGITDPGAVLADVDKPKGNAVKMLIGVLILGAVLWYSIRTVRRRAPRSGPGATAPH